MKAFHDFINNETPTKRWIAVFLISSFLTAFLYIILMSKVGEEANRTLPVFYIFISAIMIGMGCATLTETYKDCQKPDFTNQKMSAQKIRTAFLLAGIIPFAFWGDLPVPTFVMILLGAINQNPLMLILSILSVFLFSWIYLFPLAMIEHKWPKETKPMTHRLAQGLVAIGFFGTVWLLGSPVLKDISTY